ncbi:hypothetical protein BDZ90DRAFT_262138 [Jaminaea rosea]|uniref:Uncharacterized protein n=1 Tax=Jaminaea rosea TaxID=1569628 RepID=A0A316UJU4_9BASI|nr:hypothetical protein BDZ90DRAFT_262138 [Jaminaea rosea]PWN25490.1 hypothetical protein BDZ90DRAFT_262138 [Jaminaea rosea]
MARAASASGSSAKKARPPARYARKKSAKSSKQSFSSDRSQSHTAVFRPSVSRSSSRGNSTLRNATSTTSKRLTLPAHLTQTVEASAARSYAATSGLGDHFAAQRSHSASSLRRVTSNVGVGSVPAALARYRRKAGVPRVITNASAIIDASSSASRPSLDSTTHLELATQQPPPWMRDLIHSQSPQSNVAQASEWGPTSEEQEQLSAVYASSPTQSINSSTSSKPFSEPGLADLRHLTLARAPNVRPIDYAEEDLNAGYASDEFALASHHYADGEETTLLAQQELTSSRPPTAPEMLRPWSPLRKDGLSYQEDDVQTAKVATTNSHLHAIELARPTKSVSFADSPQFLSDVLTASSASPGHSFLTPMDPSNSADGLQQLLSGSSSLLSDSTGKTTPTTPTSASEHFSTLLKPRSPWSSPFAPQLGGIARRQGDAAPRPLYSEADVEIYKREVLLGGQAGAASSEQGEGAKDTGNQGRFETFDDYPDGSTTRSGSVAAAIADVGQDTHKTTAEQEQHHFFDSEGLGDDEDYQDDCEGMRSD